MRRRTSDPASVLAAALAGMLVLPPGGAAQLPDSIGPSSAPGTAPTAPLLDPGLLEPGTWTYDLLLDGEVVGQATRHLDPGEAEGTSVFRSEVTARGTASVRTVTFRALDFVPLASSYRVRAMGQEAGGELTLDGGRVSGTVREPWGERAVDEEARPGTLLGDMRELVLWISDLGEGDVFTFSHASAARSGVAEVRYTVGARTAITVPAGTIEVLPVFVDAPEGTELLHVRADPPHVTVRIEIPGGSVRLDLVSAP